jgi:hypothetical protein
VAVQDVGKETIVTISDHRMIARFDEYFPMADITLAIIEKI